MIFWECILSYVVMNSFCTYLVLTLIQSVPRIKLSLVKINPFWTENILRFNPSRNFLPAIRTLVFFKLVKPSLPLTKQILKGIYIYICMFNAHRSYGENNAIFYSMLGSGKVKKPLKQIYFFSSSKSYFLDHFEFIDIHTKNPTFENNTFSC